ncbi:carbamate kinase [bacterium]|nr:carbamate kinase [bacterium]
MSKIAVVAIGGNSLIKDKDHQTVPDQYQAVAKTCSHIAGMVEAGYEVVITHGNGPQVGFILRRVELSCHVLHAVPLDSCGADTQGAIGYHIQRALGNEFRTRGIDKQVVTVVTQVVVDADDPAFQHPSKPIGPFYDKEKALRCQREEGWEMIEDAGRGYRRVVASPAPQEIVEIESINTLIQKGYVVVSVGGGGIPVVRDEQGRLTGAAAVIDKDYASSLLGAAIGAELLLISTSVDHVYVNFGRPDQKIISHMTIREAEAFLKEDQFAPGSMEPKIKAAIQFLQKGGGQVIITSPERIVEAIRGKAGTRITAR